MVKLGNSKDSQIYQVVAQEIASFNALIKGHEKILRAIASL
ncbi:MAG: hypothetical protein V1644_01015 [Candidatus Micrarchaeota archaeon]